MHSKRTPHIMPHPLFIGTVPTGCHALRSAWLGQNPTHPAARSCPQPHGQGFPQRPTAARSVRARLWVSQLSSVEPEAGKGLLWLPLPEDKHNIPTSVPSPHTRTSVALMCHTQQRTAPCPRGIAHPNSKRENINADFCGPKIRNLPTQCWGLQQPFTPRHQKPFAFFCNTKGKCDWKESLWTERTWEHGTRVEHGKHFAIE